MMILSASVMQAQMSTLHGMDSETRIGIHAGNDFRVSVWNDGTFGGRVSNKTNPIEVAGEWPINSGHYYLVDGNPMIVAEVVDTTRNTVHILSSNKSMNISQTHGPRDPVTNEWWTFLPLPGFANVNNNRVAMAKGRFEWPNSWPAYWPDKMDDATDPGWRNDAVDGNSSRAAWNGYFGKNIFNADEESYFVADDYNNKLDKNFFPDSTDHHRMGLGLRMYVRGLQWSKASVKDGIFCLYDFQNIGTHYLDKNVFGFKVGNNMGESNAGPDAGDDDAAYSRDLNLAYMWDHDDLGAGGYSPVGYMGGAFLESPGNPYDGIDNDNDGKNGPGPTMTESMFQPRVLNPNDQIVLINYKTFDRIVTTLADTLARLGKNSLDTLLVPFGNHIYKYYAGDTLREFGDNLFDDNLNGLIDENRGRADQNGVYHYLYISDDGTGYKYINYLDPNPATNGKSNKLIDERRDDGIDNDGDWNALNDDVGMDGLPNTHDFGEGDGLPTSGRGTNLPGEPHIDKTDIDESDMLGLTSFYLYDWGTTFQYDPEMMWNGLYPGSFMYTFATANVELLYGSGYFPLVPGQTERFSMGIICGIDLNALVRNKNYFAMAYNQNYNFAQAPLIPNLRAIVGDHKVTLFWDNLAESSDDPISGKDFEGYKIYRSTDPGFNDATPITDGYGSVVGREPIAQFDLDNTYAGFAPVQMQNAGVHFWLGNNSGLRHYWTDTTAVNGTRYFYAVTSYDHGDVEKGIDPSECTKYVALQTSGEIEKGLNVVVVTPEAPSAGYVEAAFKDGKFMAGPQNTASGSISYNIVDNTQIKENNTYRISFTARDTSVGSGVMKATSGFNLVNTTTGDTLLRSCPLTGYGSEGVPVVEGFTLSFSGNPGVLDVDAATSGWNKTGIPTYDFRPYSYLKQPVNILPSGNYAIVIGGVGIDTSKTYKRGSQVLPAKPVNFTVFNTLTNQKVDFAFREVDSANGGSGVFSFNLKKRQSDEIIFLNPGDTVASWWMRYTISSSTQADSSLPVSGDILTLNLTHPFLTNDLYEFTTVAQGVNIEQAKTDLDKIKVVPNPYIVTNSWEPRNPYSNGRGDRVLHFTHLPQKCTIKIFNVRGQLVNTLEHDAPLIDGTEVWNMLSKDNLEISYGIYIYHIKADGIGEKTGKFVVLK